MNIDDNTIKDKATNLSADEALAKSAARLLNDNAQHLSAVTLKKLDTARNQAVSQLAARQSAGVNQSGSVLQWFGHGSYFDQHKLVTISMLMGVVLITFFVAQQFNKALSPVVSYEENSDAFLLASELPPEAFADKGFDTWVVSKRD
ncbi:MAG TPA: DUF3619 family protein [Methylotenera sp.]|nr:DUF3619 family protein [Methylotenera sp.]HPH04540.1 DUF3619 family protein [Methylotenera sp.]HPN00786.1 DUF3619 family protein [Methylotenera sp.]